MKAFLLLLLLGPALLADGPALPAGTRFIMSHFRATTSQLSTTSHDERLFISISPDGLNWTSLNGTNPVWQPPGYASFFDVVRDPAIIFHEGWFWVAYTSGNYGRHASFGLVKSQDLLNWQQVGEASIPLPGATAQLTWGPFFFRDGDGSVRLFINISPDGATAITPVPNMRTYETHPLDAAWTQWSVPTLLALPSANTNELTVWREGEIYHGVYVDFALNGKLVHATTTDLFGVWGNKQPLGYDGYEGAFILKKPGGGYRLYGESQYYDGGTLGYRWFDLNDAFATLTPRTYFTTTVTMLNGKVIAAPATTAYSHWVAQNLATLPASEQTALANPDGDALPNLLECATDLPPRIPGVSPLVLWLDAAGTTRARHTRLPALSDVSLALETSPDLTTWTPASATLSLRSATLLSDGRELLEWTAPAVAPSYLRLKAAQVP